MSYDIYIGQRERITDEDYTYDGVRRIERDDAPEFNGDEMTGKSNGRHPGYGQFYEFCRMVGLTDLFFDKKVGLMRQHPGCQPIGVEHVEQIRAALDRWLRYHPNACPGFESGQDMILPRLLWFDWWMTRAVAECSRPALYNS